MKLASFSVDGRDAIGFELSPGRVAEWKAAAAALGEDWSHEPRTLLEFVEAGQDTRARWQALHDRARAEPAAIPSHDTAGLHWLPPIHRPSKICCLALNSAANKDRIISGPTEHPAMFIKASSALVGHGQAIEIRREYGRVHPEPELALVVGRRAKNIEPAEAYDYVFGYTIHNDITSPTMRGEDSFHYRAIHPKADDPSSIEYVESHVSYPGRYKGSDTFSPMGPWVVTRDEIPDPHDLDVASYHRDTLINRDNTGNLFFRIPEVLAFITRYITLYPGDVISLGAALKRTPGERAVQNIDLAIMGGPTSIEINGVGCLSNPVTLIA